MCVCVCVYIYIWGKQWQTTPKYLSKYQSHTGRLTGLWFLPKLAQGLRTTTTTNIYIHTHTHTHTHTYVHTRWGWDFPHPSRQALGPTQPPIQWIPVLSRGVKRPGRGVDHAPPSSAEVKEIVELYLCSSSGPSWPVLGWTLPLPLPRILWRKRGLG